VSYNVKWKLKWKNLARPSFDYLPLETKKHRKKW
jgi:hypothetical protein